MNRRGKNQNLFIHFSLIKLGVVFCILQVCTFAVAQSRSEHVHFRYMQLPGPKMADQTKRKTWNSLIMFPRRSDRKPHPKGKRYPLLIALHGFDSAERAPRRAALTWGIDYNLDDAYGVIETEKLSLFDYNGVVTSDQLALIQNEMALKKASGVFTATLFTPKFSSENSIFVSKIHGTKEKLTIDQYARWIAKDFTKNVREKFPGAAKQASATAISGIDLGGWLALEVGLRFPKDFSLITSIQPALEGNEGKEKVEKLIMLAKEGIQEGDFPEIEIITSNHDPALNQVRLFSGQLREEKIPHSLTVLKGKRNLKFKRGAGAIELLRTAEKYLPMEKINTNQNPTKKSAE